MWNALPLAAFRAAARALAALALAALVASCATPSAPPGGAGVDDPDRAALAACAPTNAVRANGLDLEVESVGDPAAPPLLLVMGLGTQMTAWPPGFVDALVARGFRVV